MSMALPCVATSIASRGIGAHAGRDLLVADDPTEFIRCVVQLLSDDTARERLGAAARATVETNHGWEVSLGKLSRIIEQEVGEGNDRQWSIDREDPISDA